MEILRVEGLRKVFVSGEQEVEALDGVDFTLQRGELMALLGPSGTGKTVLLLCISMILEPTAGTIAIDGKVIYRDGWTRGLDARRFRRENVGFVFQGHDLVPFLTVLDNVALPMVLTGVSNGRRDARPASCSTTSRSATGRGCSRRRSPAGSNNGSRSGAPSPTTPSSSSRTRPTAALDSARGFKVVAMLKKLAKERDAAVITARDARRTDDRGLRHGSPDEGWAVRESAESALTDPVAGFG